ncbi:MAG TPA: TIGR02281 family clan AA aspartic protease [Alphaproteobacteria bacterium]|nr:TIGR02281 family clan AA aspartic protease [Alphaproteobacteria bacterium]
MLNRLGLAATILMVLTGGVFLLFQVFPGALSSQNEQIRLVQGLLVLSLTGGAIALGWSGSAGLAIKQALVWSGALIALLTVYSYRYEFAAMGYRVAGVTLPTVPLPAAPQPGASAPSSHGVVHLSAVQGGHFLADASVNGTHVRFLVDTGASIVALSAFDARRLGLDPQELDYNITVSTANGQTRAASVSLDELRIGSISRSQVPALVVSEGALEQSLLGMTFLNLIGSFEMGDGVLILRD